MGRVSFAIATPEVASESLRRLGSGVYRQPNGTAQDLFVLIDNGEAAGLLVSKGQRVPQ
jgi:hypothetical protein